jgi:hypothetical protein
MIKTPGSGRKKGTPNKKTAALRARLAHLVRVDCLFDVAGEWIDGDEVGVVALDAAG